MNSEQTMVFGEELCEGVLPGMVRSISDLIRLSNAPDNKYFLFGRKVSAVILGGHVCELLLKYKLERGGTSFERDHDLYNLYELLKDESKEAIQREFDRLLLEAKWPRSSLREGWHNAESVLKNSRLASVECRYAVETPSDPRHVLISNPEMLFVAVLSVFRTTPLIHSTTTAELTRF